MVTVNHLGERQEQESLSENVAHSYVQEWRTNIESGNLFGVNEETGEPLNAYDFLEDVLDVQYIVNYERKYLGSRLLLGFGGPNVWLNTQTGVLDVFWGDHAVAYVPSEITDEIDEVLEIMWEV